MQENRGLKARLQHSGETMAGALERLPETLLSVERTLNDLSENGLRLNTGTAGRFPGTTEPGAGPCPSAAWRCCWPSWPC
ncbi:hypothetical protein [Fodinicurvata halophila]|uniref:hypothetical protein n=1 Tax=Fodinicurvata halophila TaxID=1419723 RepID=UPI00363FC342